MIVLDGNEWKLIRNVEGPLAYPDVNFMGYPRYSNYKTSSKFDAVMRKENEKLKGDNNGKHSSRSKV